MTKAETCYANYTKIKQEHPEVIVMCRCGDFYETFGADASTVARELGICATSCNVDGEYVPLAGVPYHAVDRYLSRLIAKGHRVALCDHGMTA